MKLTIRYNSPVILTFSLAAVSVFILTSLIPSTQSIFVLYPGGNLLSPKTLLSFITYGLGHANLQHLVGNLSFILLIGPIAEEKYGSTGILFIMICTLVFTGLLQYFFFNTGLLGASGIVFMLILLSSFTNFKSKEIPLTFILVAVLFIGKEIINSIQTDHISQFAHIIGGACGSFFGMFYRS